MPEYYNPWVHTVELVGPSGDRIRIKGKSTKILSDYFDRYVERGHIEHSKRNTTVVPQNQPLPQIQINIPVNNIKYNSVVREKLKHNVLPKQNVNIRKTNILSQPKTLVDKPQSNKIVEAPSENVQKATKQDFSDKTNAQPVIANQTIAASKGLIRKATTSNVFRTTQRSTNGQINRIVGKQVDGDINTVYVNNIKSAPYRISNGVAICILSYNRGNSLSRLIESIRKTVDLDQTVVFISDDCSTDAQTIDILNNINKDPKFVVIFNNTNIGVSGNTNRLLRCAKRFEHIFILNDDVEFIKNGWDQFYIQKATQSNIQHACFRQLGVYGAKASDVKSIVLRGVQVETVYQKPHGAMLYLTNKALKICGFFNEEYKRYGMEHIDWSMKPFEFGLQPHGFIDFTGSNEFIIIHKENSSISDKGEWYRRNKDLFATRKERFYVEPSPESEVPKVTYLIPCRDFERMASIKTIINGVIGQSFPEIQIILIEQDTQQKIDPNQLQTIDYLFVGDTNNGLFNKSKAFNKGALMAASDCLILHDADMLSRVDYTTVLYNLLKKHEAMHICGKVLYLNVETTNITNSQNRLPSSPVFERMVGYFEGGSLAIRSNTYWQVGAFNEDYCGYGVEDCDFYVRIKSLDTWLCTEEFDLVHLWHSRVPNWDNHHEENKKLGAKLSLLPVEKRIELQLVQLKNLGYVK